MVEWEYHLLNQTEYFADLELGLVFNLITYSFTTYGFLLEKERNYMDW